MSEVLTKETHEVIARSKTACSKEFLSEDNLKEAGRILIDLMAFADEEYLLNQACELFSAIAAALAAKSGYADAQAWLLKR